MHLKSRYNQGQRSWLGKLLDDVLGDIDSYDTEEKEEREEKERHAVQKREAEKVHVGQAPEDSEEVDKEIQLEDTPIKEKA